MLSINVKIPAADCRMMGLEWNLWSTLYTVDVADDAFYHDADLGTAVTFELVGFKVTAYKGETNWLVDSIAKA